MKRLLFVLILLCVLLLAFAARCWPLRDVFVNGRIYFADPDCYSRMTRARMVADGRAFVIKRHDFENHPDGIVPHTTAPMDFSIAGLSKAIDAVFGSSEAGRRSVLRAQSLDLAGALIGPLLGALACVAVALALPRNEPGELWRNLLAAFLVAISPIVVHGTLLGRPDHQALLIPLLAVALALELRLLREVSQRVAVAAGVAWGLALWVSLYEPLVLLALTWLGLAIFQRGVFRERERLIGWLTAVAIFAASILLEGWRFRALAPDLRSMFVRWSADIGEMKGLSLAGATLWSWLGFAAVLAPVALGWLARRRVDARFALWLLIAMFGLTLWQVRWGYFLVVVYALTLPLQILAQPIHRWIGVVAVIIGLWPVAGWWEVEFFPGDIEARRRAERIEEQAALRIIAEQQGAKGAGAFIAPWWLSPAIAYWSGQPGVAGSSHESLPGIADTARVYLAPNAAAAMPILKKRNVRWVLSEAPERIVPTSARILGVAEPAECLAYVLDRHEDAPLGSPLELDRTVRLPTGRDLFQVWRVTSRR